MNAPKLFRSLNALPVVGASSLSESKPANSLDNVQSILQSTVQAEMQSTVQSIGGRVHQPPKWPIFQSLQAQAWEPSPALSDREKDRRKPSFQIPADLLTSNERIRMPQVSLKLANGLRLFGISSVASNTDQQIPKQSAPVKEALKAAPVEADPLLVFRSRSSTLFGATADSRVDTSQHEPAEQNPSAESSISLKNVFSLLSRNELEKPSKAKDSLALSLRRMSPSTRVKP